MSAAAKENHTTTRRTYWVACKLPHGIIIRDAEESVVHENVMGGGTRKVKVFRQVGPRIRIKGPTVPKEFIRAVEVIGGYAITEGIDGDVFDRWMRWNKDAPTVRNNLIHGDESRDHIIGWAREHGEIKSGVEPLDVSMKSQNGRQVYADERVTRNGADQVIDGNVKE